MSGHSKWAKIKRAKGATDAKRGALFTKLAKNITLAASEGGGDASMNFALRLAVDKAKTANMPANNIERAIKKGTGEGEKNVIQRISYEALGPNNTAFIIDAQTDNTNRTVSDVRRILENSGAKMVKVGSVAWQFSEKGLVIIRPAKLKKAEKFGASDTYEPVDSEEAQLELLEVEGIEDILESDSETDDGEKYPTLEIYTDRNDFASVLSQVEKSGFKIESAELIKVADKHINLEGNEINKSESLVEALEDHEDVDTVWSNISW